MGSEPDSSTVENPAWNLEDPIPIITIESNYPEGNATTDTPVTYTAKRENGNDAPSDLSYYWNFGCGHKEFGGPEISHRYTKTGNMNVTVIINSPNFTDTVVVENPIPIAQGNVLGPLGYTINTFTANGADATFTMAGAIPETAEAYPGRQGGCGLRVAVHRRRKPPGAVFLAQHRQSVPDPVVQHDDGPEPDRHGNLLQGFPPRYPGPDYPG